MTLLYAKWDNNRQTIEKDKPKQQIADMNKSSEEMKLHAVINGARSILEKKNFTESARAIFDYCREMTGAQSG